MVRCMVKVERWEYASLSHKNCLKCFNRKSIRIGSQLADARCHCFDFADIQMRYAMPSFAAPIEVGTENFGLAALDAGE